MRDVIPVDWLRMFSERELQWLISGSDAPLDVMDLRAHCIYTGGYSSLSSSIRRFWNVVNKFTFIEKRQLLRFVTSCERAPSLGFQALHPSFQIMWVTGAPNKRMLFVSFCLSLYHENIFIIYIHVNILHIYIYISTSFFIGYFFFSFSFLLFSSICIDMF